MNMTYYWLIAFVILAVIEIITQGLTTIWFAAGAVVAAIAAALDMPFYVQIGAFAVVSLLLLIFVRAIAVELFNKGRIRTNSESLVGKQAIVTEDINNLEAKGQVVVNGQEWSARCVNDMMRIEKGAIVMIHGIQGVKLIVNLMPQYQYPTEGQQHN